MIEKLVQASETLGSVLRTWALWKALEGRAEKRRVASPASGFPLSGGEVGRASQGVACAVGRAGEQERRLWRPWPSLWDSRRPGVAGTVPATRLRDFNQGPPAPFPPQEACVELNFH